MFSHTNIWSNTGNAQISSTVLDTMTLYPKGTAENIKSAHYIARDKESSHDSRGGTDTMGEVCGTSDNDKLTCDGYPGGIRLRYPVKAPMSRDILLKWLKICCFECGNIILKNKLNISNSSKLSEYVKACRNIEKCQICGADHPYVNKDKIKTLQFYKEHKDGINIKKEIFYNHQIKDAVNRIPDKVVQYMGVPLGAHPKKFILDVIPLSSIIIRPGKRKLNSGRSNNDDTTTLIINIDNINSKLPDEIPELERFENDKNKKIGNDEALSIKYYNLDQVVYDMIRSTSTPGAKFNTTSSNGNPISSLASRLPKKEGRFRQNLNGKRVGEAARSVITGDPMMPINVVGIPPYVARTISIKMIVQPYNRKFANAIYINRNRGYPGWTSLIKKIDGRKYSVDRLSEDYELQNGDILFRNLIDGDPVGFGRQPSLLFSNISGFELEVLPSGSTFRMNVSSCPEWFNADFDGDQMLIIAGVSIAARVELEMTSAVKNWIVSYKDSSPMVGLFQDSMIGAAELTRSGIKIDKWHAMQMFTHINTTTDRKVSFHKKIYTNREIVSKILPPINLVNRRPKLYKKAYAPYINYNPDDINIEIDRGQLISGVLDKATVGHSPNSLFHIINNSLGAEKTMETIFAMQQCISIFQLYKGFTVGINDISVSKETTEQVKKNAKKLIYDANSIIKQLDNNEIHTPIGRTLDSFSEELQVNALSPGDTLTIPILKDTDIDLNGIDKLVFSGSKGSENNIISINAAIGQVDVNGRRPPKSFGYKRTSPYFQRYDMSPVANGYIIQSFKEGIAPYSYLFNAQEARHGETQKALGTSVTGEANRQAIKNLESLHTGCNRELRKYNALTQPLYSGNGFDPRKLVGVKIPMINLSDQDFKSEYLAQCDIVDKKYRNKNIQILLDAEFEELAKNRFEYRKTHLNIENFDNTYLFTASYKSPVNIYKIVEDVIYNYRDLLGGMLDPVETINKVIKLCKNIPYAYMNVIQKKNKGRIPEHIKMAVFQLQILIRSNLCVKKLIEKKINNKLLDIIIEQITNTFATSLISYGIAMGIIAAQCLSEPLSQYVLDSKHRSGAGGGSMTSVIIRVKEILGAKSTEKMKNPIMRLFVEDDIETDRATVQEIANHIKMLNLNMFVSKVHIFYENYRKIVHPDFKHEEKLISDFEKRHKNIKIPNDLLNWCIRFELKKEELILKSVQLETVVVSLQKKFKELFIVFTPENSDKIILRCYIKNRLFKKPKSVKTGSDEIQFIIGFMNKVRNVIISGIEGIISATVVNKKRSVINDGGEIKQIKIFAIETYGSNFEAVLDIEGIDIYRSNTDSIVEMTNLLGIEAGRETINNELRTAMKDASPVHVSVYADEMCHPGIITSIQKTGMSVRDKDNTLLRAGFSHPVQVIEQAMHSVTTNKIRGISAPLSVGRAPKIGTTYSSVIVNQEFIKKNNKTLGQQLDALVE